MEEVEYILPLDSREFEVDLGRELRHTIVDLIRGSEPRTILGVLLASQDGITVEELAARLDKPIGPVGWNVEKLEEEDLCVRIADGGTSKVRLFAAYSDHND